MHWQAKHACTPLTDPTSVHPVSIQTTLDMPSGPTLAEGYEPSKDGSHAVFTKPIESSQNDDRSYRLIRLNNDLEVLLIHDATADKSAAALDVHVGHLSDPVWMMFFKTNVVYAAQKQQQRRECLNLRPCSC